MAELTEGVNWLAVGHWHQYCRSFWAGLWYSPMLFAKKWIEGVDVKPNPDAKMPMPPLDRAIDWNIPVGLGGWHYCRAQCPCSPSS